MKADVLTLHKLFRKDVRYLIPSFQRPYVWTEDNQWEPLWEDIRSLAEGYLTRQDDSKSDYDLRSEHFLGAIVLQQQMTGTADIEIRDVIDGQQRLTTLQLVIDAARVILEGIEPQVASNLSNLVVNNTDLLDGKRDHEFKVWPTLEEDRIALRYAMQNGAPKDDMEEADIVQAHSFFKAEIEAWIQSGTDGRTDASDMQVQRALALENTLTKMLHLVVIDLSSSDDSHIIFETLNARGTPLLDADLIKNHILREGGEHQEKELLAIWDKLEESWWRVPTAQGRISRPRIDVFLNYWITMRMADEVQTKDVYSTFRNYANGKTVKGIADDIGKISGTYQKIQTTKDNSVLGKFLYRWRILQAGALTPALMWLLSSDDIPESQQSCCLQIIESFLMRRSICRMTSAGYNNLFLSLLKHFDENEVLKNSSDQVGLVLMDFLEKQTAHASRWPSDHDLERAFVHDPLYNRMTRGRLRIVLEGIEEEFSLRAQRTEDINIPKLTIEHFMPRGWRTHWPLPLGASTEEEDRRDHIIHTIGNLTLVTKKLNSELKNAPFDKKSKAINDHSVLYLKNDLLQSGTDTWNEEKIMERSKHLAGIAAEVWPHADVWRERLKA